MRDINSKELCHENLGNEFNHAVSDYDTQRRVELLIDGFLKDIDLKDSQALDVGCGLGFFSKRLTDLGSNVIACDIGPSLVENTVKLAQCRGKVADALNLNDSFQQECFDLVISSECIEHTPAPKQAIISMIEVLKPGGYLVLSTPNLPWWPMVKLSTMLNARPYNGYEKFSTFGNIQRCLENNGMEVIKMKGLHLFPFQLKLHRLSRFLDKHMQFAKICMINVCVIARKR